MVECVIANDEVGGSNPLRRSITHTLFLLPGRSTVGHQTLDLGILGSIPSPAAFLFVSQRFNWIQAGGADRGSHAEDDSY